ncbi:hypothetical protein FVE85_8519 [Porphyridium purpureum]|uniref:CCHC-type domain-containing protein n=1 Tax=Porphyridium purpureum TaxID=35688 RepID=A0A5J4YFS8_PORPP|nr:hypothetical protein FVE85_8519 [Porphyridium purpureum]|eukprot:POR4735..scf257_31
MSSVRGAPLFQYLGERNALAVRSWTDAAQDRVHQALCDEYQAANRMWDQDAELRAIRTAATFLGGSARLWWSILDPRPQSFAAFLVAVRQQFEPAEPERQARDHLAACSQRNRPVSEYASDFADCLLQISAVVDGEKFDRFVRGLAPKVQIQVRLKAPTTYESAVHAALSVDPVYRQAAAPSPHHGSSSGFAPMDLRGVEHDGFQRRRAQGLGKKKAVRSKRQQQSSTTPGDRRQGGAKPTGSHVNESRDRCRRCGERGHWANECLNQHELGMLEFQLRTVDMPAHKLLKMAALIDGLPISAVVDTGATATFLSLDLCERIGLRIKTGGPRSPQLRLANGRREPVLGYVRTFLSEPGVGARYTNACVHHGHHDTILGLDWLNHHQAILKVGEHSFVAPELASDEAQCTDKASTVTVECHMVVDEEKRGSTEGFYEAFNDTVSVDLLDPAMTGRCGTRGLYTHRDSSTGWYDVIPLAKKTADSALTAFLEVQRGRGWPRIVKSDGGSEFAGSFDVALLANLVAHESGLA